MTNSERTAGTPELEQAVERVMAVARVHVEVYCERCKSGDACISQVRWDEHAMEEAIRTERAELEQAVERIDRLTGRLGEWFRTDEKGTGRAKREQFQYALMRELEAAEQRGRLQGLREVNCEHYPDGDAECMDIPNIVRNWPTEACARCRLIAEAEKGSA